MPKDQLNTLKVLCGLDLSDLEERRNSELRTAPAKQIKMLEATLASARIWVIARHVLSGTLMEELKAPAQESRRIRRPATKSFLKQERRLGGEKITSSRDSQVAGSATDHGIWAVGLGISKAETAGTAHRRGYGSHIARIEGAGETSQRIQANNAPNSRTAERLQDESVKPPDKLRRWEGKASPASRPDAVGLSLDGRHTYNGIRSSNPAADSLAWRGVSIA